MEDIRFTKFIKDSEKIFKDMKISNEEDFDNLAEKEEKKLNY